MEFYEAKNIMAMVNGVGKSVGYKNITLTLNGHYFEDLMRLLDSLLKEPADSAIVEWLNDHRKVVEAIRILEGGFQKEK